MFRYHENEHEAIMSVIHYKVTKVPVLLVSALSIGLIVLGLDWYPSGKLLTLLPILFVNHFAIFVLLTRQKLLTDGLLPRNYLMVIGSIVTAIIAGFVITS